MAYPAYLRERARELRIKSRALYVAEGSKRCRNTVSIANSDERMIALATAWLRKLSRRKWLFSLQYHADQELEEISDLLGKDSWDRPYTAC